MCLSFPYRKLSTLNNNFKIEMYLCEFFCCNKFLLCYIVSIEKINAMRDVMKTQQDIQQMISENDFDLDIINTHIKGMQYETTVSIYFGDNHSCTLQVVDDYKMVETNISNGGQDSNEVMISFVKCIPQTAYISDGEIIDGLCDFDGWNQLFTEEMLEPINQILFDIALRNEGIE